MQELSPERLWTMTSGPLVPRPDNFTPPSRTPWGGRLILQIKAGLGIKSDDYGIVGESWEISGHESFPNIFLIKHAGGVIGVPFGVLSALAPIRLYGKENVRRYGYKMPFLTKFLNSGSNLSVQVHPPAGYKPDAPPKTEGWYVIAAEPGAGCYIGLKNGVTRQMMQEALASSRDIMDYLNFVEFKPGEVYYIPTGTPHAIGAGLLLYELQETSETTYRYYDYSRVDGNGNPRQLHVEDALAVTSWDAPRGDEFVKGIRRQPVPIHEAASGGATALPAKGKALEEQLIREQAFEFYRITFKGGDAYRGDSSSGIQGMTVVEGRVSIYSEAGVKLETFGTGQSFIVPAAMGRYVLVAESGKTVVLSTTAGGGSAGFNIAAC